MKGGMGIITEFVKRRRRNQVSHPCSQSRLGSPGGTFVLLRDPVRMFQRMQPHWRCAARSPLQVPKSPGAGDLTYK